MSRSGRGVLTRSRLRGPRRAEGKATLPDRAGDFSPRLEHWPGVAKGSSRRSGSGFITFGPRRTAPLRQTPPGLQTTTDGRDPLDRPHPPSGRQLDGLPRGGARVIMREVCRGLCRFWIVTAGGAVRALILLGSGRGYPRASTGIEALPTNLRHSRPCGGNPCFSWPVKRQRRVRALRPYRPCGGQRGSRHKGGNDGCEGSDRRRAKPAPSGRAFLTSHGETIAGLDRSLKARSATGPSAAARRAGLD